MRMDGTVALDMGRAPGASAGAIALAGDLCVAAVQATGLLRHGAGTLVRGVVAALRRAGRRGAGDVVAHVAHTVVLGGRITRARAPAAHRCTAAAPVRPSRPAAGQRAPRAAPARRCDRARGGPRVPAVRHRGVGRRRRPRPGRRHGDHRAGGERRRPRPDREHALDRRGPRGPLASPCATPGPGPVLRPAPIDPTAARGRGLQMVDALTTAWGVTLHAGGKTVWAVLGPERA